VVWYYGIGSFEEPKSGPNVSREYVKGKSGTIVAEQTNAPRASAGFAPSHALLHGLAGNPN
jgi:hypothetical protein